MQLNISELMMYTFLW